MRSSIRALLLLLVATLATLGVGVLPAQAHARLLSITPTDGASLPASPTEIVLTFNEPINPEFVTVRITDGEGGDVVGEEAATDGATVTLPVGDAIAAGTYNVIYRVVSADSHPISGSARFTIEGDPQAPPATATAEAPSASVSPPSAGEAADASEEAEDIPAWVWILVFAGLVGAIGATFYAVRRDESAS
ncbi:copper resistance protein CopC [Knoellia sinensis KCTC 19936]|uniref:Copper resistance protein CopC n=1 Tax=Knoellia sinensis KCTC 19936 TaxID=1385520 RepID=A0A0A0JGN7_9MICO|nr:copper resistance CopC family protein [Knoellia sinensis]KGN34791.1 copper resistance protein CopC [Knoellia sinensis KCTC 19936]